jgi:phosphoenolpyruvate-protein kinase (PTS system EI component)
VVKAKEELHTIYERMVNDNPEHAEIFLSHQCILEDEEVLKGIQKAIEKDRMYPDTAIEVVFGEYAKRLATMPDSTFAERIKDFRILKRD